MTFQEQIALEEKHNKETVKTYGVDWHELPFTTGDEAEKAYQVFCKREGYTVDSRMSRKAFADCHRYFNAEYAMEKLNDCKRFIQFGRDDIEFTKIDLFDGLRRGSLKVRKIQLTAEGTAYLTFFRKPTIRTRLFEILEQSIGHVDEDMAEEVNAWIDELEDDPKRIAQEIWDEWCDRCEEANADPNTGCINYSDED